MKATFIDKTILMWNNLSDIEAKRVVCALANIIKDYRDCTNNKGIEYPIPIPLYRKNRYLAILLRKKEIIISTNLNDNKKWIYNPILNGDELYKSITFLESYSSKKYVQMYEKNTKSKWIELPFIQAFEEYSLHPSFTPQKFQDADLEVALLAIREVQKERAAKKCVYLEDMIADMKDDADLIIYTSTIDDYPGTHPEKSFFDCIGNHKVGIWKETLYLYFSKEDFHVDMGIGLEKIGENQWSLTLREERNEKVSYLDDFSTDIAVGRAIELCVE